MRAELVAAPSDTNERQESDGSVQAHKTDLLSKQKWADGLRLQDNFLAADRPRHLT